MNSLKPYLGRLMGTVLGLVVAMLFIFIGFAKTMLIVLCCTVGYLIGVNKDKGIRLTLPEWARFWRNRW